MARDVSNMDDMIDSRDVIARIEELEEERTDLADAVKDANDEVGNAEEGTDEHAQAVEDWRDATHALVEWDASPEAIELRTLKALAEQCEGYGDWQYGESLIRESHFQAYAMELAEDIGAIPKDIGWPCTCIDWEQATRELMMDYMEVDFDGVSYLMRS